MNTIRVSVQTHEIAVHASRPKLIHSCCSGFFDLHANAPPGPSKPTVEGLVSTHPKVHNRTTCEKEKRVSTSLT